MSLKIRFRFDGRCSVHPRYNPERDGRPQHKDCPGCDALYVIHLYSDIARRKADSGKGILVSRPEAPAQAGDSRTVAEENAGATLDEQGSETESRDTTAIS